MRVLAGKASREHETTLYFTTAKRRYLSPNSREATVEAKTVEISHVWSWFVRGWQLFTLSPWMWMGVTLLAMVIAVVALVFIPGYGGVIVAFLVPTLYGGVLFGVGGL